jgi:DNA-binding response OmpR family regulator
VTSSPSGKPRARRVLIADDEPNIVTSLEYLMVRSGFEVRVARDGNEALAAVQEFAPDLVLLDVMMPAHSGYEVAQRIREHPQWSAIKIVMLTAKGRDTEVSKGLAVGADAYVTKPFSTRELVALVARMLGSEA